MASIGAVTVMVKVRVGDDEETGDLVSEYVNAYNHTELCRTSGMTALGNAMGWELAVARKLFAAVFRQSRASAQGVVTTVESDEVTH